MLNTLSGSIPACAGEPRFERCKGDILRVYPRVCGGTPRRSSRWPSNRGLSPRVRGNPGSGRSSGARGGSIPACAGEPLGETWRTTALPVYPRVCGGTQNAHTRPLPEQGLSPRVRGNPSRTFRESRILRSIPACAGEPARLCAHCIPHRVYPRVCGGTRNLTHALEHRQGLSPRVRGNPLKTILRYGRHGSIPACAGEPASRRTARST